MKKFCEWINTVCCKAIWLMILFAFCALTYWSVFYSNYFLKDLSSEKVYIEKDQILYHLLFAGAAFLILYVLQKLILRGSEQEQRDRVRKLTAAAVIVIGIGMTVWVSICHIKPEADQLQVVYVAQEFAAGDYHHMKEYMDLYPQQYGLVFFYEILFKIWDSYRFLQYLNVLFVMMIAGFGCMVAEELFHSQRVNLYCLTGFIFFLPLYFYVNFVYGEICSVAMVLSGIWCLLKRISGGKCRYTVCAVLCMLVATLVRRNTLVFLIAVVITLCLYGLVKRNWRIAAAAVLILVIPLTSVEAVKYGYEKRTGIEIGSGVPAVMWIAMGMQDSGNGAGAYNGYNNSVFRGEAGGDPERASQIGSDYIQDRIQEFAKNPKEAWDFYRTKLQQQWNEASYGCLIMTGKFDRMPAQLVVDVYFGDLQDKVLGFMNQYTSLLYLLVLCCAGGMLLKKPDILKCLLAIAVIGGLLFSLLWEAKSRYVFPYIIVLIPYGAYGFYQIQAGCEWLWKYLEGKKKQSQTKEKAA